MLDRLDGVFLGISAAEWAVAALVFVGSAALARLALTVVLARADAIARRTRTDLDDLVIRLLRGTRTLFLLVLAGWLAAETLPLPDTVDAGLEVALIVSLLIQIAFWGSAGVGYLVDRYRRRQLEVDPGSATAIGAMSFLGQTGVWLVTALLVLDNLGVDVAALVTGLGIGGIAVALALQNVLSDLFASLSIVLDKPFVVGDFIIVGDFMGTVEHVGLKSTRIRSLSGEQIVFSNSDLLASRVRNYKRMAERRVAFKIGVTKDTPAEKLRGVPAILRAAVERHPNTRFDRSHFMAYGDSSLDFETVYYVLSPDYNQYADVQQAINLEAYERFRAEGIELARPTRTLFVDRSAWGERAENEEPASP